MVEMGKNVLSGETRESKRSKRPFTAHFPQTHLDEISLLAALGSTGRPSGPGSPSSRGKGGCWVLTSPQGSPSTCFLRARNQILWGDQPRGHGSPSDRSSRRAPEVISVPGFTKLLGFPSRKASFPPCTRRPSEHSRAPHVPP